MFHENKKKEISNNVFMFRIILKCCPQRVLGEIFARIGEAAIELYLATFFLEYVFSFLENKREDYSQIIMFIIASVIGMIILKVFLIYYSRVIAPKGNQLLYERLNLLMFEKVNDVELACYENPDFYKRYTKAASQTKGTALKIIDSVSRMAANIFSAVYILVKLLLLDKIALLLAIIPLILSYCLQKRINHMRYEFDMANVEPERQKEYINRTIYQAEFAKEIRLTNIDHVLFERFHNSIKDLMKNLDKYGKKLAFFMILQAFVSGSFVFTCFNIYAGARLLFFKNIKLSGYVILATLMLQLYSNLSKMTSVWARFSGFSRYIENLRTFLQYEPQIAQSQDGIIPDTTGNSLKLEHVSFTYHGQDEPVLKNINMAIKPKEKIALVGHNGAGKSTLVKLMMRLYDVDQGAIFLNDTNIKDFHVRKYRDLFGVVFQDYKVMSMSVAENVMMREVTDEDTALVEQSLVFSGIYDKVMTLKRGIHTTLTREFDKDGVLLSGGEFQKIAIARLFAKTSDFAILDEPSSALDPIAEYEMYENMMKVCEDKSVVFISHRMSSAVLADKIYLLENGEIVESGTHKELMDKDGKYAKMFRMQALGYKGGVGS